MSRVGRRAFGVGASSVLVAPGGTHGSAIELARALTVDCPSPRQRAHRLMTFVRDEVLFGFTARFDHAPANATLRMAKGHCNPQARLFATMLRAVGIRSRYRIVQIDAEILAGLFTLGLPPRLDHAFVEFELDGEWIGTDGYIVDPALAAGAKRRLRQQGRTLGYGVHIGGNGQWDGESPCMSQLVDPNMVLQDWGTFDELETHFRSPNYGQRLGLIGTVAMALLAPQANRTLERLRAPYLTDAGRRTRARPR